MAFDDLNDVEIGPRQMPRSSRFAGIDFGMERPQNGFGIGGEAIDRQQDRLCGAGRSLGHFLHQSPNQVAVSTGRDFTPEPKAGKNDHRRRHPGFAILRVDAQFIGLCLAQVNLTVTDDFFLHLLTLLTRLGLPVRNRPFIQIEGLHNGLRGAAIGQQLQDQNHDPTGVVQIFEDRPLRLAECFLAPMTDIAPFLVTMDTDTR